MNIVKRLKYEWIYLRRIRLTPKGLFFLVIVIRDSLKWCFSINLGNHVIHSNGKYYINNGVTVGHWDGLRLDSQNEIIRDSKGIAHKVYLPRNEVKKVYYITTPFNDFMQGFRFYMGYWYGIWVYKGLSEYKKRPIKVR